MTPFDKLPDDERRAIENAYAEFTARMWQRIEDAPTLWTQLTPHELYRQAQNEVMHLIPLPERAAGVRVSAVNLACLTLLLWQRVGTKEEANA